MAILAVIFNHSNWHVLRNYAPGDPSGYGYIVTDQIGKFAISAFMFIAGYFICYATSAGKNDLRWEFVRARLLGLLWPWLFWSMLMTVSLEELIRNLFIQYYFIPLLMVYYLAAPFISRWIRLHPRGILFGSIVVQLLATAIFYVRIYLPAFSNIINPTMVDIGLMQYLRFAFFFPFGMIAGMAPRFFKDPILHLKPLWPWLVLVFFILAFGESAIAYSLGTGQTWPVGGDQTRLTSSVLSVAIMICFLVYENIPIPFKNIVVKLGARSYGLYLSHYVILGLVGKAIHLVAPWSDLQGWWLIPVLFLITVFLSMTLMELVSRLPTKHVYRLVFG
jgi:peptidoglycan/LPS O-acetylase OafA/YrhL